VIKSDQNSQFTMAVQNSQTLTECGYTLIQTNIMLYTIHTTHIVNS